MFVLVHGGPAPLGEVLMLGELAGRLAARGARAFLIDYRSDAWENAVYDVEAALSDLRRLTSDPITLVSHSFGGIPALVAALRDGKVDALVMVNSSVRTSYSGFPDAVELAKRRPSLPVSVVRSTGDTTGAEGREEFITALHAAGHPGLNVLGPGDHTGPLYTSATLDAILATAAMIHS
jgi:pimeloyl-ACP methyl ester carboxylesterase